MDRIRSDLEESTRNDGNPGDRRGLPREPSSDHRKHQRQHLVARNRDLVEKKKKGKAEIAHLSGTVSIEETEKVVPDAGGEQVAPRQEIPNVGKVSYFKDTEGNIFGALEPAAQ